jgi:hypothetical protein
VIAEREERGSPTSFRRRQFGFSESNEANHCPICGMSLAREMVTHASGPSAELADMTRRFWIGLILAMPVIAASAIVEDIQPQ